MAGGAFATTKALSSPAPAAATSAANSTARPAGTQPATPAGEAGEAAPAGETVQAAVLSSAITAAAGAPGTTPAQRQARVRRARGALRRLRVLGGEHGEFTFRTKKGTRTLAFERGTVVSVAGSDVTVRAADGTTWAWALTSASVVRDDGSRASSSALSAGERVFAGGPVTGPTRDARLIVVHEPSASPSTGSS